MKARGIPYFSMTLVLCARVVAAAPPCPAPTPSTPLTGDLGFVLVAGTVFSASGGLSEPVANAVVELQQTSLVYRGCSARTETDDEGRFGIQLFLHDTDLVTITVRLLGFETLEVEYGGAELMLGPDLELALVPRPPTLGDFSTFLEMQLTRHPALGFCPQIDRVFEARLVAGEGESLHLQMSVLEEGDGEVDDCLPNFFGSVECAVARALPERNLVPAEVDGLRTSLAGVQYYEVPDPICEDIIFDPCLITNVRWDDVTVSDYRCGGTWMEVEQLAAIEAVLEGLRPSETPASPTPTATPSPTGTGDDVPATSTPTPSRTGDDVPATPTPTASTPPTPTPTPTAVPTRSHTATPPPSPTSTETPTSRASLTPTRVAEAGGCMIAATPSGFSPLSWLLAAWLAARIRRRSIRPRAVLRS